ncbi:MAG: carbonic anhydrase [Desulfobulbaceae bacterium]|nr:hypothetical protein [Chloroflexota bacterium]TBV81467.1 MAG: carbonic anhydrase [Desulfobulbaceae bacterium]
MPGKLIFSLLLLLGYLLPTLSQAALPPDWQPQFKIRAGIPPFSTIGRIMDANHQALQGINPDPAGWRLTEAPHLVWLADADFRIGPEMIWDRQQGGILMVSNLANQVEQAAAALDYAIYHRHTPVLLITGNSDSRAIALFNRGFSQTSEAISRELNQLRTALAPLPAYGMEVRDAASDGSGGGAGAGDDSNDSVRRLRQAEHNVDYQVARALERYRDRIKTHRLVVVGGIIDLANYYGGGPGRLYLINLNGEIDPAKIKTSPHLVRVAPDLRGFIGRR